MDIFEGLRITDNNSATCLKNYNPGKDQPIHGLTGLSISTVNCLYLLGKLLKFLMLLKHLMAFVTWDCSAVGV